MKFELEPVKELPKSTRGQSKRIEYEAIIQQFINSDNKAVEVKTTEVKPNSLYSALAKYIRENEAFKEAVSIHKIKGKIYLQKRTPKKKK